MDLQFTIKNSPACARTIMLQRARQLIKLLLVFSLLLVSLFSGCAQNDPSSPGTVDTLTATPTLTISATLTDTPTLTPTSTRTLSSTITPTFTITITHTVTPTSTESNELLIDDFEDGDKVNLVGGDWFTYADSQYAAGGTSTIGNPYINSNGVPASPLKYLSCGSNDLDVIIDHTPSGPGTYYGFVGVATSFTASTDISSYTGIRFYIRGSWASNSTHRYNVCIVSQYELDNTINTHYRKEFPMYTTTAPGFAYIEIPFSDFTLDYSYDSPYPSHPKTLNETLQDVVRIGWDKEITSTTYNFTNWSQNIMLDHVELY